MLPTTRTKARARLACAVLSGCALLSGCAGGVFGTLGPDYARPEPATPAAWQAALPEAPAPVPHQGSTKQLAAWWAQFRDPTLDALIASSQQHSGTLAQAAASIARARADAITAGVAASPSLDAIGSVNRAAFTFGGPLAYRNQTQLGVQSSWEIDLFGGLARQRESADAQLQASIADWHEARVSLAAETANTYASLRLCERQLVQATDDARSRAETARITDIAGRAGLQGSATVALARAAASEASAALSQRRAQCDIAVKGLVALTEMDEPALRALLAKSGTAKLPEPARFDIQSIPARVITQRPDIAAAERRLASASAAIGQAEADRYPRLTLSGNITPTRVSLGSAPALSLTTWSIGPSLLMPLVDGGRRAANVDAARAQYAAAESAWRARVRNAVREVEEALVRLASSTGRQGDTAASARGYRANLEAAQARLRAGLGSVLELEEARRLSLAADAALDALEQERVAAWIALYRAVGGGWDAEAPAPTASR